jgi:putative phage-type endonuclease
VRLRSFEYRGTQRDREAWLLERAKCLITSSEVPVVMGAASWQTPEGLLEAKTLGVTEAVSPMMWWGDALEETIVRAWPRWDAQQWGRRTIHTRPWKPFLVSRERPWWGASPDALARVQGRSGLLEIKKPMFFSKKKWEAGCPPHYEWQCRSQLYVTGLERCWLVGLIDGFAPFVHLVERDLDKEHAMIQTVDQWVGKLKGARQ